MNPLSSPVFTRLAAIALLVAVIAVVYGVGVAPLLSAHGQADRAIAQANELMARYQRVAARRDALEARLEALRRDRSMVGIYLDGDTDALAAASLQEVVNATVEGSGGRLRSIQILPAKDDGKFRRISVRAQMSATIVQLARLLYAFEANKTYLFVDNLDVANRRARRRRNQPIEMDPTLIIRLDLSGYMRPEVGG